MCPEPACHARVALNAGEGFFEDLQKDKSISLNPSPARGKASPNITLVDKVDNSLEKVMRSNYLEGHR